MHDLTYSQFGWKGQNNKLFWLIFTKRDEWNRVMMMICGSACLSEPCFPEIFRMPRPFSLFSPPNTFLSVLMLLPHLPLTCLLHLRIYDSLRPSTPLTLVLETVISWFLQTLPSDCYLILGYVLPWRSQENKALRDTSFWHSSSDHLRPGHFDNLLGCSFCLSLVLEVWWQFHS